MFLVLTIISFLLCLRLLPRESSVIKLPAAGRGHDLGCNNTSASSQRMQPVCVVAVIIAALFGCSIRGAAGTGEWSILQLVTTAAMFDCYSSRSLVLLELPPASRVYLLRDTKTFTCQGRGNPASLLVNNLNPVGDNAVSDNLQSMNITWTESSQGSGVNVVTTFTITMTMTLDNNGTTIWCGFQYGGPLYYTKTTVIAVAGKKLTIPLVYS